MAQNFTDFNYLDFYSKKSVLPSHKFKVILSNTDFTQIKDYHVVDVNIPTYKFQVESTQYGPVSKSYPTLNHKGFAIDVTYEEDSKGTIIRFINELQRTIVKPTGVHKTIPNMLQDNLNIILFNQMGQIVCRWEAQQVYFLGADDIKLSYDNPDSIKYHITFGCDIIKFYKYKIEEYTNYIKPIVQGAAIGAARHAGQTALGAVFNR